MSKYFLSILLLLLTGTVLAQKPGRSRVKLEDSEVTGLTKINGKQVIKTRKGVFRQDFSTLTADSSFFYEEDNLVDAFGHVVINQGDTLHIFSDKLHYDGNTKLATLTGNVKMVDKDATLLTDYLTYNTATKIGTYTGGGKLFNKENTLTSKNGYYFSGSRDAYFRYNVVLTTTDAIIKTDTLRYNSESRIAWFYGPTNIYGTKDKDVLYTENGRYETITEQAFFGKKNLYTQGSKSLKGDSLFYDRLKGYGRAIKNVVFDDKEQRATVKGHLGEYYKEAEKAVITQHPYVIFVTQDSAKSKGPDSLSATKKDSILVLKEAQTKKNIPAVTTANVKTAGKTSADKPSEPIVGITPVTTGNKPSLKAITDSVIKNAQQKVAFEPVKGAPEQIQLPGKSVPKDSVNHQSPAKVDSMYLGADTIVTRVITVKEEREMRQARYFLDNPEIAAVKKSNIPLLTKATLPKVLKVVPPPFPRDSSFIRPDFFGPVAKPIAKSAVKTAPLKNAVNATTAAVKVSTTKIDSSALKVKGLSDTSRIRIILGYHSAKIFKSDLQAKADSIYYSSSDSTIRLFVNPIIWTQGSQLTGDTINLQMKNKKIDNVDLFPNGFIVNIEKNDSLHFNQAAGKKIHGTFKDNRLNSMEITGNAESIYYNRDSVKNIVTEIIRSASNVAKASFKNGRFSNGRNYGNIENKVNAVKKVKDDDKILKGFIWKPQERPLSKEAITGVGGNIAKPATPVKTPDKQPASPADTGSKVIDKATQVKPPADKQDTAPAKENTPPKQVSYDIIISN